jgi:photosystem II stability/assembly factor-like uncharacterized protein
MFKRFALILSVGAIALLGGARLAGSQEAKINTEVYKQMRYRYIGSVGNRAISVVSVPGNPLVYYVGAASGGIFRTTDGGIHWEPIFDDEPVSSIGSLAIAPSDPSIVWAGTGEPYIRSHISIGQGIYKSVDSGKTWTLMGLEKTARIANVIVDPKNSDVVYACSLGTAYGPQQERGVYRTSDGGKNWERVLFVDENTGCSDLTMDPNNPHVLFAGMWQIEIHTWGRSSGGVGSGLFKSIDGGMTWKRLEGHGLPHPPIGRIAVRVAQRNSNRVYAEIETGDGVPMGDNPGQSGQLWRSDDAGETWQLVNSDRDIRGRTHYYTREEISPDDENEVYFFSAAFSHTLDGGKTLTPLPSSPGGDNHEMWIDPTNADRMAVVNDGGVSISVNHGQSWDHIQLPIAQIYHVTVDNQIPYNVYGNRQDGSSYAGPSNSLQFGGFGGGGGRRGGAEIGPPISRGHWHPVSGGESGFATVDPQDPNIVWNSGTGSGSVGGTVMVYDQRNGQARSVEVWPETTNGSPAGEIKYRFNWEFPIEMSPFDHHKVYVGSQYVHVTTDGGNSWQVISPDLTRNDKTRETISGGLTPDNIGVEYAGVVFSIAESPKQAGLIWAGTNDGLVQITRDGGKNWTNVTANIPGLPEWGTVDNIEASRWDAGTAYITVDFHQVNNRDPYVYKTNDFGKTWTKITNGIPVSNLSYAHCVREDAVRKGLLYLGTENALYVSFDDGANWQPFQNNLAHAPVYWIANQEQFHDLAIATYGRGFWILDDVSPLQQLTPEVMASDAHLFTPRDAYRFRGSEQPASVSSDPTTGNNPPYGADINYYLKAAPKEKEEVKLVISDASGKTVRTIEGKKEAGINRVWWDLRFEPTAQIKMRTSPMYAPDVTVGPQGWREAPGNPRASLLAPPGTYTIKLTVAGKDQGTQKIRVLKDPHSTGSEADIETQNKLERQLMEEINQGVETVNTVENVRAQIAQLENQLGDDENSKAIRKSADDLSKKLVAFESNLMQLKATGHGQDDVRWPSMLMDKIFYLADQVSDSDFPPNTQQQQVHELLKGQLEKARADWAQIESKDLAEFNAMLRQKNVPNIISKTP